MNKTLLPTRFLFRFAVPCKHRKALWTAKGAGLGEAYRLIAPVELEGKTAWAEVRAAWSEKGLAFRTIVRGKRQPPSANRSDPEQSEGLHLWIDTRDVHNIHHAGRFCHRFAFLPEENEEAGKGKRKKTDSESPFPAFCTILPINRAKEHPAPESLDGLRALCKPESDGYQIDALIPAEALTGFDPAEHPRLGFTYAVIDRELGEQTFSVSKPMPYQQDPSLWATLELVR